MNSHAYLVVTGFVFAMVTILHGLRVLNGWGFQVGPWSFPMWVSWLGMLFAGALCVWALKLAAKAS